MLCCSCSLHLCCALPILAPIFFFFFNDTATTEIYTLSLHDALPICRSTGGNDRSARPEDAARHVELPLRSRKRDDRRVFRPDRKSTRLNSSHVEISYAVFCLKKKKKATNDRSTRDQIKKSYNNMQAS